MQEPVQRADAWWTSPFRVFQTNLRETDADLDVDEVLDHIVGIGANTWLLNTAGIVSFYPSDLPFQRPSPWLSGRPSGDLVGEAISRAHERGVRVICRVDLSKIDPDIAEEHPDWCFVGPTGKAQIYNGLHSTCPSGDYYQYRSIDILGEVLDRYEPDAFFFNMFKFKQKDYSGVQHGICHCANCQTRFEERYGHALPVAEDFRDEKYQHWLAYSRETINEVSNRIHEFVQSRRPECAVLLKEISDVTFREANNAVDRPEPLWVHWAGELVQEVKGSRPDKPVCVNSVMFVDIPYRFTPEQSGLMALHLQQTAAYGGNPMAYMLGTPPEFKPAAFDVVRDFFTFHRDNERYYTEAASAAEVALVSSQTREEFFGEASTSSHAQRERRGLHIALIRSHIPFDIVSPEYLEATGPERLLGRFRTIVLPGGAPLTPAQAAVVDEYVRLGGGLVATGDGGATPDADALPLESLGATAILDRLTGSAARAAYLRPDPETDAALETAKLVALDRAFTVVRPKEGATAGLTLVPAARYGPPEKCHWDSESDHPGLLWYSHGEGRTAYLPWPVGELFHDLRMPEHRSLLAHAVAKAGGGLQVTTTAPEQVEVVVSGQPNDGRTLVHLINYSGHNGRTFAAPLDIHDVTITLHGIAGADRATALRAGRALDLEVSGDAATSAVTVTLPVLAGYELIVVES